jgi:hypothetical protein
MGDRWYVAYGSNTSLAHFTSRFVGFPEWAGEFARGDEWVWVPYEMYFASSSQTWGGSSVAFVSLDRTSDPTSATAARAYLLDDEKFDAVLAAEHASIPLEWAFDVAQMSVGTWCPLPTRAKYNAVLRVADISGLPAFTVSSARHFDRRRPSDAYLSTCREGLVSAPLLDDVDQYLGAAIERSLGNELRTHIPPPGAPLAWRRTLVPLGSTGYPTVQLGDDDEWIEVEGPFPGTVEANGRRVDAWFLPPQPATPPGASPQVFRSLGFGESLPDELRCRLSAEYAVRLERRPGLSEDIEIADRVQVAPETAQRLATSWALMVGTTMSGPVRLSARGHVPPGAARVPYATRELWEMERDTGSIALLPLPDDEFAAESLRRRFGSRLRRTGTRVLEVLLGAPAVPLRATEAVVGDEGRTVVRVDATALDFLGVRPGEEVIVSWAGREVTARALLQTSELRERMRDQLAQITGRQSRLATRARVGTGKILWHLQVWVSPAVRDALVIPPDTIVRLRRSVVHVVLRHFLALLLPVGGLTIAVLAIPGIPWPLQVLLPLLALVLAFVPVRLART